MLGMSRLGATGPPFEATWDVPADDDGAPLPLAGPSPPCELLEPDRLSPGRQLDLHEELGSTYSRHHGKGLPDDSASG